MDKNIDDAKRVSPESETRNTFPTRDELAAMREKGKKVIRTTAEFRWAKFIVAQQKFRRAAEALANSAESPNAAHTFWYQNDQHITLFLVIAWSSFCQEPASLSSLRDLTGLSQPFLRKALREAHEKKLINQSGLFSPISEALYGVNVAAIFKLSELRDLGNSISVLNLVENKPNDIR